MRKYWVVWLLSVFYGLGWVVDSYAGPAPVYDATEMLNQPTAPGNVPNEETATSVNQDIPPPSPPPQTGAYVPNQTTVANDPILPPSPALSLEQRVNRLEQQLSNLQNSELNAKVESLQGQIQVLRGQVEQLAHQQDTLQKQLTRVFQELDQRVIQQSTVVKYPENGKKVAINNKTVVQTAVTDTQPKVAEEQRIYQMAYNYIKAKKYNEAITTLQTMLKKYPSGQFAANAHYWLGELYGLLGRHDQALNEFNAVVKDFSDSPRVGDAQLKVGLIYAAQLKWPQAKSALQKVMTGYPGTASARLAKEQLKQIKEAGH